MVACLRGAGLVDLGGHEFSEDTIGGWAPVFTSEDPQFGAIAPPPDVVRSDLAPIIRFAGPGAVILRAALTRSVTWAGTAGLTEHIATDASAPRLRRDAVERAG